MRPVARIAQSVEQGIENPRVLGSIPSPGTTIQRTQPYGWVFAFGGTDRGFGNPLTGLPRVSHAIFSAFMVSLLSGEINKKLS